MKKLEAKHPRAIRWFHWINFPLISIMIWSGALIYWANDVYRVGVGDFTLFHFFPIGSTARPESTIALPKEWRGTSCSCGCSRSMASRT